MGDVVRTAIINEQTLIIDFEPEAALKALPRLLPTASERQRAIALIEEIAGDPAEMSEPTTRMLAKLRETLAAPLSIGLRESAGQEVGRNSRGELKPEAGVK
jgi:hypothetical protein